MRFSGFFTLASRQEQHLLATFGITEPMPSMSRILLQTGWPISGMFFKQTFNLGTATFIS